MARRAVLRGILVVLTKSRKGVTAASVAAGASGVVVLRRMRRELSHEGQLSAPTTTAMYMLYGAHALAVAEAARRRSAPVPVPGSTVLGGSAVLVGAALTVAGMSRFAGPGQISGTDLDSLVTGGVYRFSRNPQYVGYVLGLAGLGAFRRSGAGLALAAAAAGCYVWWVPVEEAVLEQRFGAVYTAYRRATPRWLGRPSG